MAAKKDSSIAAPVVSDKKKALETAMQQIEKTYGKGSIMRYGDNVQPNVEAIPTGSLALDLALGIGGLPRGRIVEIYGPESSGKTTLALTLMRLLPERTGKITSGSITFEGRDVLAFSKKEMASFRGSEVAMIFQNPMTCLNPVYTVGNQLIEALRAHDKKISKADAAKRAMEMLELVGINNVAKRMKQYPHEFSGGMRQRVMIAMGLICHPKLLIADEPTTALDVTIQAQILELMKDLQKKTHMGIIFITHNLSVVEYISDRIAVMYLGRIVELSSTEQIFDHTMHPYTEALLSAIPKRDPSEVKERIRLEGDVPSPANPPKGCAFHDRCARCMGICKEQVPAVHEPEPGHTVACHLYD